MKSRSFATSQSWRSDVLQQQPLDIMVDRKQDTLDANESPSHEDRLQEVAPSTPWYLEVETPQRVSNPLLERQQLPPLPPDPPPLLRPMLEHISIDLGLDDLVLFDLRSLDPPPALGANLLMVIGTARSEKHLHVSADRFCRWLKVTHKLSPYADGLLGRGELKLKLRRKARRARLLSNVGSSDTRNLDDGIRTGWICVNVGSIQDGRDTLKDYDGQEGYVGFGSEVGGAKVVIQMLTQEKREELDLEDLWGKTLRRHERKEDRIAKGQDGLPLDQVGQSPLPIERPDSDAQSLASPRSLIRPTININQSRRFHQMARYSPPTIGPSQDVNREPAPPSERSWGPKEAPNKAWKSTYQGLKSLRAHVNFLRSLPPHFATKALGRDFFDHDSTTFLESFYGSYPESPSAEHWECRLAIVSDAVMIGHPGYMKTRLMKLLDKMQSSFLVPEETYVLVYRAILTPNPVKIAETGRRTLTKESLCSAVVILDSMHSRGYNIDVYDLRYRLYNGAKQAFREKNKIRPGDPDRLKLVLDMLHSRLHQSPSYSVCLRMFIECCDSLPKPKEPRYKSDQKYDSVPQSRMVDD